MIRDPHPKYEVEICLKLTCKEVRRKLIVRNCTISSIDPFFRSPQTEERFPERVKATKKTFFHASVERGAVKIKVRWIRFHLISKCVTLTPRFWIAGCPAEWMPRSYSSSPLQQAVLPLSTAVLCPLVLPSPLRTLFRDIRDISSSSILKSTLRDRTSWVTWSVIRRLDTRRFHAAVHGICSRNHPCDWIPPVIGSSYGRGIGHSKGRCLSQFGYCVEFRDFWRGESFLNWVDNFVKWMGPIFNDDHFLALLYSGLDSSFQFGKVS